jgi:hypothetical protein
MSLSTIYIYIYIPFYILIKEYIYIYYRGEEGMGHQIETGYIEYHL